MTQEDKDLLLRDLCARLAYGVILKTDNVFPQKLEGISFDKDTFVFFVSDGGFTLDYMDCKPYLFPMSSMTEEQYKTYCELEHSGNMEHLSLPLLEWLNKNHFDYRGLIEKGLAIDASGLNIY
jgi:hypothetical protein